MFYGYVKRGLLAGAAGGLVYGLFVALVATPLIAHAETFEGGHHEAAVPDAVAAVTGVGAGVGWGLLLGVVAFGLAYFFLEPAIPGRDDTKSYLLGAAGFITVSGAPWLVLPPQPPGLEQALSTETRIAWYAAMMAAGALACGLSGYAYRRFRRRRGRLAAIVGGLVPFALLAVSVAVAPANPVSGPIPSGLAVAFRGVVIAGQVGLWVVLASTHAWLARRASDDRPVGTASIDPDVSATEV